MTKQKKIGIITYWESNDNYGQQLQCWALQHYLRLLGYEAFLIRQHVWPPVKKRGLKRLKQVMKKILAEFLYNTNLAYVPNISKYFTFCLDKEACRRKFPKFRKENLFMSQIYETPEELVQNPPKADIYITGSDQVWNYSMPEKPLSNFFLQFGDDSIKRISYAASVGHLDFPNELKEKIQKYLTKFSAISVRERLIVNTIAGLGYSAEHVLDPTMLLTLNDYTKLVKNESPRECIYIYSMNYSSSKDMPFEEIQHYAHENNLPIIVTPGSGYLPAKELFDGVEYSYATIPQWIQHIASAKLVVTASFHGIVFAILFHRPFIYTPLNGAHSSSNIRVTDLLDKLDLGDRIWNSQNSINDITTIDWYEVDKKLGTFKKESINYLKYNLN